MTLIGIVLAGLSVLALVCLLTAALEHLARRDD